MTATEPKISEALLAFAAPLLELLPDGAGPAQMTPPLRIAVLVWNAVALELLGHESRYLDQARDLAESKTTGLEREFALAMLADMEDRKRSEDQPDQRIIGDFEFITGEDVDTRLRVNCQVPPARPRA